MIDLLLFTLTFLAALGCGLIAGFFLAFSACVMKALARLPPSEGVAAMQSINVVVINPIFLGVFFGTAVICVALGALSLVTWPGPRAYYILAACALYLVGVILVTMGFNVPLNNMLAPLEPHGAGSADPWKRYLDRWTAWNHVRTAAPVCAMALLILALR